MPFVRKTFYAEKKQKAFLFLIRNLGYTQKEAQRLIAKGRLLVNNEPMTYTAGSIEGEFEFIYFEPITKGLIPLFQTKDFVIFDKPSGVLIHPQSRRTPYSLLDEIKFQFGRDANITHRIDQETSGIVLSAKHKQSEIDLKMMFQERDMQKYYLALVHGQIDSILHVNEPLLRKQDISAMVRTVVKVNPEGKASETTIIPLQFFPELNMTLVEAKPLTGRQHQIRVHLFHVKHPIVGDPIYGQSDENVLRFLDRELSTKERIELSGASRLLLHANKLEFNYGCKYSITSKTDFIKEAFSALNY
ncbi:MAG: RluA family pseudouridine synthase [Campylobacterota bacterium]|nr:RluA family pseudouridine synthase [Campylobacterota bacterium]